MGHPQLTRATRTFWAILFSAAARRPHRPWQIHTAAGGCDDVWRLGLTAQGTWSLAALPGALEPWLDPLCIVLIDSFHAPMPSPSPTLVTCLNDSHNLCLLPRHVQVPGWVHVQNLQKSQAAGSSGPAQRNGDLLGLHPPPPLSHHTEIIHTILIHHPSRQPTGTTPSPHPHHSDPCSPSLHPPSTHPTSNIHPPVSYTHLTLPTILLV